MRRAVSAHMGVRDAAQPPHPAQPPLRSRPPTPHSQRSRPGSSQQAHSKQLLQHSLVSRAASGQQAPPARSAPRLVARCEHSSWARQLGAAAAAAAAAVALALTTPAVDLCQPASAAVAAAAVAPQSQHVASVSEQYEALSRPKRVRSRLPSSDEAAALSLLADSDMFTPEAWAGMLRLQEYARFVERLAAEGREDEAAAANRLVLEKAWQTVANEYYDPSGRFSQAAWANALLGTLQAHGGVLQDRAATYAALHDLTASLGDRYSAFLEPSAFRRALRRPLPAERNYLAAQFVGVGIQLGPLSREGGRLVEAPLAESPAEAAGIRKGDRVLAIEGAAGDWLPAEGLALDEVTTLLRGPAGSMVRVLVAPAAPGSQLRQLSLERRALPQPAVKDAQLPLGDGRFVQYARLHYFSHESTQALTAMVAAAEVDGRVAGYVLDLRNDPGGVFEEAVAAASLFEDPTRTVAQTVRSPSGVVDVSWQPSRLARSAWPDLMAGPLTSKPLVLLVNGSTASASEVLAGALHDYRRATTIGERTFGKGVVQARRQPPPPARRRALALPAPRPLKHAPGGCALPCASYFPLGDGSGLKLTTAKYLTPSGHDISSQGGLSPDITCRDHPHGVFTPGRADNCVLQALDVVRSAQPVDPLSFSPLLASKGGP